MVELKTDKSNNFRYVQHVWDNTVPRNRHCNTDRLMRMLQVITLVGGDKEILRVSFQAERGCKPGRPYGVKCVIVIVAWRPLLGWTPLLLGWARPHLQAGPPPPIPMGK